MPAPLHRVAAGFEAAIVKLATRTRQFYQNPSQQEQSHPCPARKHATHTHMRYWEIFADTCAVRTSSAHGIDRAWICVGLFQPKEVVAVTRDSTIPRSANEPTSISSCGRSSAFDSSAIFSPHNLQDNCTSPRLADGYRDACSTADVRSRPGIHFRFRRNHATDWFERRRHQVHVYRPIVVMAHCSARALSLEAIRAKRDVATRTTKVHT